MTPIYKYQHLIDTNKLNWYYLSGNENAIPILEQNINKISWSWLSRNSNAIKILEKYPHKIGWFDIAMNKTRVMNMLESS